MNSLNAEKREKGCKSARKCRKQGKVPGIFYGKEALNFMCEFSELELNREVIEKGEHGILDFTLGNEEKKALIKEVQRDPVTHKIVHIDLNEVGECNEIQTDVAIQYVGEGKLLNNGTILQKEKDSVKVSCAVDKLPKSIKVDVSRGVAGSVFKYSDLEIGEEISIVDNMEAVIASVSNEKKINVEVVEDMVEIDKNTDEK
ncbi:MAG: 50S ribosomal protein L25 [Clostridium sp.]|uniref:50S ribosomal protein L25 n=1 Tax=Clostridium sp. TaxID=1506 RepID=UPI003F33CA4D